MNDKQRTGAERLAAWHKAQCNGDWEHMQGVTIETTDNPGWWVKIDLDFTSLAELTDKGKRDLLSWEAKDGVLHGYCEGTCNLEGLLTLLCDVLEGAIATPAAHSANASKLSDRGWPGQA